MKLKIVFLILLIQVVSRFAVAPVIGFVNDDWSHYERATHFSSACKIVKSAIYEPSRPLQSIMLHLFYRVMGRNYVWYGISSIFLYSLFLYCAIFFVYQLTGDSVRAYLFGLFFSVLPNLTESFHWVALISVCYLQFAWLLSAWCWLLFVRKNKTYWLVFSVCFYAVGIFSYESGILLPLAFSTLVILRFSFRKILLLMAPYFIVLALYFLWRYSAHLWGGIGVLYAPRTVVISAYSVMRQCLEILNWWVGPKMIDCVWKGLMGFSGMPGFIEGVLIGVNVLLLFVVLLFMKKANRVHAVNHPAFKNGWKFRVFFFGITWCAVTYLPCLVSWTAGRLNFLPSIGLLIAVVAVLDGRRVQIGLCGILLFMGMIVNQGTARQWRESAQCQEQLFQSLADRRAEWEDKDLIVINTFILRNRLNNGLKDKLRMHPDEWAYYGNASLFRGFVPKSMLDLIAGRNNHAPVLMDVECGVEQGSDVITWHDRYAPGSARKSMPNEKVMILNVMSSVDGRD